MPEKQAESKQRLFLAPAIGANVHATDCEIDTFADTVRNRPRVGRWAAYIQIGWPEGIERHPNMNQYIFRNLDRICGIDHRSEDLGLTYALVGESIEEAEADASEVLTDVLGWLSLGHTAVRYCTILDLDQHKTTLRNDAN